MHCAMETRPMFPEFNRVVVMMADLLMPQGYLTTDDSTQCDTLEKVTDFYDRFNRVLVWTGESDHTIFGDPKVNHAFRAWHDWVHINYRLPFTKAGELQVQMIQQQQIEALDLRPVDENLFKRILECEIEGQLKHFLSTGEYVKDQRQHARMYLGITIYNQPYRRTL